MKLGIFIRLCFCIAVTVLFLYAYISKQNAITKLRLEIPTRARELQMINEENVRLQFSLDQLESPDRLLELAGKPEYSHLKYPLVSEIITIPVPKEK